MTFSNEDLKRAVVERHSVRVYKEQEIEAAKIEELKQLIDECNKEGNLHLQFVEHAGNTLKKLFNKASGLGTAPSLIACIGPDDDTLDERIGYYGQKIVLYAQLMGLNTCWVGTFNKKENDDLVGDGEKYPISIAIGYAREILIYFSVITCFGIINKAYTIRFDINIHKLLNLSHSIIIKNLNIIFILNFIISGFKFSVNGCIFRQNNIHIINIDFNSLFKSGQ